ncbi:MAG: hypothetical protein ACPGOV_03360 [Magnetovibrionaceae bacterium]
MPTNTNQPQSAAHGGYSPIMPTAQTEQQFMSRMMTDLKRFEADAQRIYTDHKGIPTMGIGRALAYKNKRGALTLDSKANIEALIDQGTGQSGSRLTRQEYKLLQDTVSDVNAGKISSAKARIPGWKSNFESASNNKFGFRLTDAGMESIVRDSIDEHRDGALRVFRSEAKALGWNQTEIAAYEQKFRSSPQMMALASMHYNGVRAPKATNALLRGDAPTAYDEITYQSNGGSSPAQGIANRRVQEGGLFMEGIEPKTAAEKAQWRVHMQQHGARIQAYEQKWGPAFSNGGTLGSFGQAGPNQTPSLQPDQGHKYEPGQHSAVQSEDVPDDMFFGESGSEDDVLLGGAGEDIHTNQQQLIDAFTADVGQSDILYKRTEDITEEEIEGVMKSDTYWESNNPDYLASKEKVTAFYELNYGTDPVERDATGRMIDSGPKRKIPTEATPAKAADGNPLSQAIGDFAKSLSKALETANHTDQVKTAQEAVNILNNRSQKNGNESPQPMLAVDGQAGPKTRAALKNTLVRHKPSHVQDSVALASFKPTVQKAAQSGTAHALNQATGKSFGGLFSKPKAQQTTTAMAKKPKQGSGPTPLGRRAEQSSPQGFGLQIALNDAAEDHGLFASNTVEPLREDGIVGPKTEAAFGMVAKEIGSDDMLDRIGQGMGLFS